MHWLFISLARCTALNLTFGQPDQAFSDTQEHQDNDDRRNIGFEIAIEYRSEYIARLIHHGLQITHCNRCLHRRRLPLLFRGPGNGCLALAFFWLSVRCSTGLWLKRIVWT